jgi:tetratricopeptide (TPR) repeat protein
VHYPKWIIVAILAFCFALYGNTMFNQFALDDTMVLTQNEFVKQGVAGIPKIFKYDTFIGRYGEKVTNLPGGRYRPLSVALLAAEFDIFVNPEVKQIVRNRLDSSTMQYAVPRKYIVQDMLPRIVDSTQSDVVIVAKPTPKQNEDDAPLYMKTALPYASHGVNILLYALVACFLFKLLWRLFPARDAHGWKWLFNVPVIATLLFVAHPVHVEAVANIKGRDEIMTFLGALMAMFYTLRWLDTRKTSFLIITFLCFLAGAFSKENALTFLALIPVTIYLAGNYKLKTILLFMALIAIPVFLLLKGQALAFLFVIAFFVILIAASPSSQMRTVAMALLPSFAAGLVFTCVRWSVISMDSLPETELMNNPFLGMRDVEKWASIIYGLGRYLWLLIFPHPLTTDYYPYHIPKVVINNAGINEFINTISIANPAVWMPLLIYGAMFAFIIWGLSPKRKNIYAYAILWYLVPLSIVCNVFVMIGTYMNERFVYISSVGFCLAIACFAVVHLPKWLKNERTYRLIVTTVLAAVLGLYSFQSISRNRAWFDDFTLSTTDARQSPRSAKANYDAARVYNIEFQRATTDSARAAITRQIYYYSKRAIEIHPVYENALLLYSWSNTSLGTMHPDSAAAYPQEASVKALLKLLERNPASPFAFDPLIMLSQRIPDPAQRIPFWEAVLQRAPERYEVHYQLASIYGKELSRNPATGSFNLEQMKKAIPYFENAIRYKPDFVNAFIDLGAMYGNTGEPVKAVDAFRKALDISPSDTLAWANLWRTYSALGDAAKASDAFQKYQSLRVRK